MKKLFLGLVLAGTMMSFTPVEKTVKASEDTFDCTISVYESGRLILEVSHFSCQEARAVVEAMLAE